jgi:hypothetical protein
MICWICISLPALSSSRITYHWAVNGSLAGGHQIVRYSSFINGSQYFSSAVYELISVLKDNSQVLTPSTFRYPPYPQVRESQVHLESDVMNANMWSDCQHGGNKHIHLWQHVAFTTNMWRETVVSSSLCLCDGYIIMLSKDCRLLLQQATGSPRSKRKRAHVPGIRSIRRQAWREVAGS